MAAVVRALLDEDIPVEGLEGVIGSSVPTGQTVLLPRSRSPSRRPWPRIGSGWKAECRRAEHDYVGVQVGIMDQLASPAATEGHALLIDCSDNRIEHVPVPHDLIVLVVDSGAGRGYRRARTTMGGRTAKTPLGRWEFHLLGRSRSSGSRKVAAA